MRKPKPDFDRKTGEILVEGYHVDILKGTCSCPLFVRLAEWAHLPGREALQPNCKHLRATLGALRDAYTLFAPFIGADLSRLLGVQQAAHLPQPAPVPKPKDCPLCGGELLSLAAQGFPADYACTRCGRTHDEASLIRADDATFAPAPKINAPAPKADRHTETGFRGATSAAHGLRQRGGRGVPACKRCFTAMDEAVSERTGQEGHRCAVCGDFLPLGSLRPIPMPLGSSVGNSITVSH